MLWLRLLASRYTQGSGEISKETRQWCVSSDRNVKLCWQQKWPLAGLVHRGGSILKRIIHAVNNQGLFTEHLLCTRATVPGVGDAAVIKRESTFSRDPSFLPLLVV